MLTGDSLFVGDAARPDLAVEAAEGAEGLFHSLHRLVELGDGVGAQDLVVGPAGQHAAIEQRTRNRPAGDRDDAAETAGCLANDDCRGDRDARIGDVDHPWVRAYVNETDLGKVKIGSHARVTSDSFPAKSYDGRVSFISSEAEFTPKQIQTRQERVKLVYRIKIDVDNPRGELKSNMPVDAEILLGQ